MPLTHVALLRGINVGRAKRVAPRLDEGPHVSRYFALARAISTVRMWPARVRAA
jgi:hypothetical protein